MNQLVSLESQLLLACSRVTIDARQQQHIQHLITAGPDWELLIMTARRHGLCSLLHRHLSAVDQEHVPSAVIGRLTTIASNYRRRNLVLVTELLRVVAILEKAGISVIPYKGPALAQYVYRDYSLREFVDLDILVKPRDAIPARRVLMAAGLPAVKPVSRLAEQLHRYFHCEFGFVLLREVKLEVNWRPAPAYWLLPQIGDKVWERLDQLRLAGVVTACLDPIDQLIVLCVHGCKHLWDTLKWLVDVAELLRCHSELDWVSVQTRADEMGAGIMVEIGLVLAHDLLQAPVPANILETARRRPRTTKLVSKVRERSIEANNVPFSALQELPFVARAAQKPGAKVMPYVLIPAYFILHRLVRPAHAQLSKIVGGIGQRSTSAAPKKGT
jgi:hypothetical protein